MIEKRGKKISWKLSATVQTIEKRINACSDPPSHGLFLTCTGRDILLFYTAQVHIIILHVELQFVCVERKGLYLEWWLLVRSCESPSLLVSCPKSNAPLETPNPPRHLSPSLSCRQYMYNYIHTTLTSPNLFLLGTIQLHTDNINKPGQSRITLFYNSPIFSLFISSV